MLKAVLDTQVLLRGAASARPTVTAKLEREGVADKYSNFVELANSETRGRDFRIRLRRRKSATVIIAPHGGGIAPGTSEIAEAIAAQDHSFYAFEDIKARGNRDLHITSSRFDEARCVTLAAASARAVTIHGEDSDEHVAYLGGLDGQTIQRLGALLTRRGFDVRKHPSIVLQLSTRGRRTTTVRFTKFVAAVREALG